MKVLMAADPSSIKRMILEREDDKYIAIDKVKQAREEIENIAWKSCNSKIVDGNRVKTELIDRTDVLKILDKLIESEEK